MFKDDDEEEDNTFGVTRYPCMPSLVALQQMKNRLHLASLGKKLMKWTAVAATTELRNIALQMDGVYKNFSEDMCEAFILLARCRYFTPSLNEMVTEGCPAQPEILLTTSMRTASGVKIIKYDIIENNTHPYEHLGIGKGGQTVLDAKKAWLELLKRIILMVELRRNFKLVEEMQKSANNPCSPYEGRRCLVVSRWNKLSSNKVICRRKMNVLGKVVVPKCRVTCMYITDALEELARDEFYRRKMILEVKAKESESKCSKEFTSICEDDQSKTMRLAMNDHVKEILQLVNSIDDKQFSEADVKDVLNLGEEITSKLFDNPDKDNNNDPKPNLDKVDYKETTKSDIPTTHKSEISMTLSDKVNMEPVEVEIKEITKIMRIRNTDGTYREVKKTIKIKKETKNAVAHASNSSIENDRMYQPTASSSISTPSRETRIQMMKIKSSNISNGKSKQQTLDKEISTVALNNLSSGQDLSESSLDLDIEYLRCKFFCTNCPICTKISSEVLNIQDAEKLYAKYHLEKKIDFEQDTN